MKLSEATEKATPGPVMPDGGGIMSSEGLIASTWGVEHWRVSDERMDGESWLDMRVRTQPERDACRPVAKINAALFAHWHNHGPRLLEALRHLQDLINESYGVAGLHLNGDTAPWGSLCAGGQFEAWLGDIDGTIDAASEVKGL